MRKAYLLVYNDTLGPREFIKIWANQSPLVMTWRCDLPHCFYLISDASADELTASLREFAGDGRFLISEISENRNGYLPSDTWFFFRNKRLKPKP